jgi:hypothetical protein
MTVQEFNEKWNEAAYREAEENTETFRKYIEDCFEMYETGGFVERFKSPYDQFKELNGKNFRVVGRCTEEDWCLEQLPAWIIEFDNGVKIEALPEEICKLEAH